MKQVSRKTGFTGALVVLLLSIVVSISGEELSDWRTHGQDLRVDVRAPDSIEGVVAEVSWDGDDIFLRRGRDTLRIDAHGGVRVWYRGGAYRVCDLERGDLIRVQLAASQGHALRARSVDVLGSISHERRRRDDREWDDRYDRDASRITGRIVALDRLYAQMVVRVDGREIRVDLRNVERGRGRSPLRSIRVGDVVRIEGDFHRGIFIAWSIDELHGRDRRYVY